MSARDGRGCGCGDGDGDGGACARCAHWADDRALLEARIAGLASFGSAYGATVGASRLCRRHDRLTMPRDRCASFAAQRTVDAG